MSDEYGNDFVTIIDDDGNEFELELIDSLSIDGKSYSAFLPTDMAEDDPDYGLIILRTYFDENGDELFESIDDDDELQQVYEMFLAIFDAEDDE